MDKNYHFIIDAGHGGINKDGVYTTGKKKQYTFTQDGYNIYEGVVNRAIAAKFENNLEKLGLSYSKVYDDIHDVSLSDRVRRADDIYHGQLRINGIKSIFISLHSNSASVDIKGKGTKAHGVEIYTSKGQTSSDKIASYFLQTFPRYFPNIRIRSDYADGDADKEADYYVLRKTDGPAILIETLFFDNRQEAEMLKDINFQNEVAEWLSETAVAINHLKLI